MMISGKPVFTRSLFQRICLITKDEIITEDSESVSQGLHAQEVSHGQFQKISNILRRKKAKILRLFGRPFQGEVDTVSASFSSGKLFAGGLFESKIFQTAD